MQTATANVSTTPNIPRRPRVILEVSPYQVKEIGVHRETDLTPLLNSLQSPSRGTKSRIRKVNRPGSQHANRACCFFILNFLKFSPLPKSIFSDSIRNMIPLEAAVAYGDNQLGNIIIFIYRLVEVLSERDLPLTG